MSETQPSASGYEFNGRLIEPRQCPIEATGAAVLVNSIGSKATFRRGKISKAILAATGDVILGELEPHKPLTAGQVVITSAGELSKITATRYIFHVVITDQETNYRANPKRIAESTARAVQLADLLGQESIAVPALGSGAGRGKPIESVKQILNEIIRTLPNCRSLEKVIFSTISTDAYQLFHNRALVVLALAYSEQQLKEALGVFPPSLYGLVGEMLQRLEAARLAGDSLQADQLRREAEGLQFLAAEMQTHLPDADPSAARAVQLIVATGGSIIQNITQQTAGDRAVQVGQAGDVKLDSPK